MTNPRHAEATDRGRYYTHPQTGEQLVSVTNVLDTGMGKPALVPWAAKVVAEHSWDLLPAMVAAMLRKDCDAKRVAEECGRCRPCLTKALKRQVTVVRESAADLGSRVHALAEAHVTGQQIAPIDGDDKAEPFVRQYERFLADYGVDLARDIRAAELTVAYPGKGYAGTLDLIVDLPLAGFLTSEGGVVPAEGDERRPWIVDIKTSTTRPAASVYDSHALQLAALRHAREMWLPDDTTAPMPRVAGAAVLNLRQRTYELVPLPADTPEVRAFDGALALTKWAHTTGAAVTKGEHRPVTPAGKHKPKNSRTRKAA